MKVLAIDPGNVESAYCLMDSETLRPEQFAKVPNEELRDKLPWFGAGRVVIERIASYGMAVGRDVFETCEWVGQYTATARMANIPVDYVYRKEEKLHICGEAKAKDANIRRALIDRFARHDLTNGKGTKKNPDWFHGFHADVWQAYAVGITYIETRNGANDTCKSRGEMRSL